MKQNLYNSIKQKSSANVIKEFNLSESNQNNNFSDSKTESKKTISNLMSTGNTISALIQAIPSIGGTLNQLVFGQMQEIRIKKIEKSLQNLKECFENISQENIDQKWCSSEEALQIFKSFIEKIEVEPDQRKIKILCSVFSKFFLKQHSNEENKLLILLCLSQLTYKQIDIFSRINILCPNKASILSQSDLTDSLANQGIDKDDADFNISVLIALNFFYKFGFTFHFGTIGRLIYPYL